MVTPPRLGVAVTIWLPAPTYSNVWELATILLPWEKYAVEPTPTALNKLVGSDNEEITEDTGVEIFIV